MRTTKRKLTMLILGAAMGFGVGAARADLFYRGVFDNGDSPAGALDDPWAWGATTCDGESCRCDMQLGGQAAGADFYSTCDANAFDQGGCRVMTTGFWERSRPSMICTCSSSRERGARRNDEGSERPALDARTEVAPSW
jgi:hypothetical protein